MSEKRFVYGRTMPLNSVEDLLPCISDKETENVYVRMSDIVNLLNSLNDERMMYKTTIDKRIVELNDENEQLRQSIEHMISKATEISNRNVLLHEEIGRQTRLNKELQQKLDWICEQTGYDGAKFHHLEK